MTPDNEDRDSLDSTVSSIWKYKDLRVDADDFTTAIVQLYRADVSRTNTWRMRLDVTTNWAILTTGAAVTFSFTPGVPHSFILLDIMLAFLFMCIEARRYRYYTLWAYRSRLVECELFAPIFKPPHHPNEEWAAMLHNALLKPTFCVSFFQAFCNRLKRNYLWIFLFLYAAWFGKLLLVDEEPISSIHFSDLREQAAIGQFGGDGVLLVVGLFLVMLFVLLLLDTIFTKKYSKSSAYLSVNDLD